MMIKIEREREIGKRVRRKGKWEKTCIDAMSNTEYPGVHIY